MSGTHDRELNFFFSVLKRLRIPARLMHPGDPLQGLDHGLRSMLGWIMDDAAVYHQAAQWNADKTIYKVMDQLMCHYIYFRLPESQPPAAVVVGPYLTIDPSREMILEQTERLGLPLQLLDKQVEYYASLPVFNNPTPITALASGIGEVLWGDAEAFDMVDVNYEQSATLPQRPASDMPIEQEDILQQMKQMEERYAYENELMDIVAKGLTNQTETIMASVSSLNYQPRLANPLRNMQNYCIICNTLLRKAAERGGVHPLYLDRMSSQFARTIENTPTLEDCSTLIGRMIRSYCRMVRSQADKRYSAIVDRTLTYIGSNLSGDLSLTTLASVMKVSPSYLSATFRREKGETLTAYITACRMKAALQLLRSTRLQVQTIAQLCGYTDPNYFARHFRKHFGVTPLRSRNDTTALPQNE